MAIIYCVKISNPNNVKFLPPTLETGTWKENFDLLLADYPVSGPADKIFQYFPDIDALTDYVNSITLSAENQAALNEWITANDISFSYEIYDLSSTTAPKAFGI